MAFGSLSIESRSGQMMRELGVSIAFVSALTRIEKTKLSLGFRQLKPFSIEDGITLSETLSRLLDLCDCLSPLTVDLQNPERARKALDAFEGMDPEQIREKIILALFIK